MRVSERIRRSVDVRTALFLAGVAWVGCSTDMAAEDSAFPGASNSTGGSNSNGSGVGTAFGGASASTGGAPTLPPEVEKESSFKLPVQSGRWVWSANPESGRVSVIDTRSLTVELSRAGFAPTYLAALPAHRPPLVLKIAPDLTEEDRRDIARVALELPLDGLIVSNTTIERPPGLESRHRGQAGGRPAA